MCKREKSLPINILSATSFLPLWGQSMMETPLDISSERMDNALGEVCSLVSKYALNTLMVPYL